MIFDTNVLIYLSNSTLSLHEFFNTEAKISVISKIEALGFAFKNAEENLFLIELCSQLPVIPLSDAIAEETIAIRKNHRIKLADAIIYSTAFIQKLPLLTNNIADFKYLGSEVELINPFDL